MVSSSLKSIIDDTPAGPLLYEITVVHLPPSPNPPPTCPICMASRFTSSLHFVFVSTQRRPKHEARSEEVWTLEEFPLDGDVTSLHAVGVGVDFSLGGAIVVALTGIEARSGSDGLVKRVETPPGSFGHDPLHADPQPERAEGPEETADRRGQEGPERGPVVAVQPLLQQQQVAGLLGVAVVVDQAEQEDGEQAAEAAHDDLEPAPGVGALAQADDQHGDAAGADEVADQVDLQDAGALEGHDDDGEDEQHDGEPDVPKVQPVAEDVVGARAHHGALEAVKGRRAEGDGHDDHDPHDPRGELLEQQEERDAALLGRVAERAGPAREEAAHAHDGEDDGDRDRGEADAHVEVPVGLGRERAHPETRQEEVVGQDGHGEDVEELPPQEGRVEVVGLFDQVVRDFRLDADRDDADDDQAQDHGALDVVRDETDLEPAQRGVDRRDGALHNDSGQAVQTGQGIDDLLKSRELGDHVEEERYEANRSITLISMKSHRFWKEGKKR